MKNKNIRGAAEPPSSPCTDPKLKWLFPATDEELSPAVSGEQLSQSSDFVRPFPVSLTQNCQPQCLKIFSEGSPKSQYGKPCTLNSFYVPADLRCCKYGFLFTFPSLSPHAGAGISSVPQGSRSAGAQMLEL